MKRTEISKSIRTTMTLKRMVRRCHLDWGLAKTALNILIMTVTKSWAAGRKKIFENFSLEEFFAKYETQIKEKPKRSHLSSPENNYPPNWDDISLRVRRNHNWQCACCEAFFMKISRFCIHTIRMGREKIIYPQISFPFARLAIQATGA